MEQFDFNDRPNNERISLLTGAYSHLDSEFVSSFLSFQWSYRKMQRQYDKLLDSYGLSESKFIILMFLKAAPKHSLLSSEIAEKLGCSRPTASKLLKSMETKELVKKLPSKEDKRSNYFQLTKTGSQELANFLPANFSAIGLIFSQLQENDLAKLEDALGKIDAGTKKLQKRIGEKL